LFRSNRLPGDNLLAMNSIRVYLIATILAVITLFNFVAALRGYQSSLIEADLLFDSQLFDSARIIARINPAPAADLASTPRAIEPVGNLAFQIWDQGKLRLASADAPAAAIAPLAPGFDHSNFNGYRWRTISYYHPDQHTWVLVAQRTDLRYALAENVVLESILPILTGLPLVALLIWLIVTQGLKPLRTLAAELANRQADNLQPLSIDNPRQELAQIVASSNVLLARLETSLEREKRFAADAAHELRTPISALKVQLFNIGATLPENDPNVAELTTTVQRLENIVEQILALYRNSPDQYHAAFTRIDLFNLTEQLLAHAHPEFDRKNQQLELSGDSCHINGDHFALTTLLQNLLTNASKYTPAGGQIRVHLATKNNWAVVTVEDSGPGIAEELRHQVFERFYRVGGDRHQSGEPGSGLGLAIVKGIAELHGATVKLSPSGFASGCAFQVSFPCADPLPK